jgi:hypothetical protein
MDIGPSIDTHSPTFLAAERECRVDAPGGRLTQQQEAALNEQMLRFASCMRANGVRAFPDPVARSGHIEMPETNSPGLDKDLPVFRAAQTACQGLLDARYVGKLVDGLRGKPPAGSGKSK